MAVLVEAVVDRGVDGGEFPQCRYIAELRHRCFSSSERLVCVFSPIVEPPAALPIGGIADCLHRRSVRTKPAGYHRRDFSGLPGKDRFMIETRTFFENEARLMPKLRNEPTVIT